MIQDLLHRTFLTPFSDRYTRMPKSSEFGVQLTYLGTAGFVFSDASRTIVVDPYVTRPSIFQHLSPLDSNPQLVSRWIPTADDVLIGHAHHDHILDAPCLCRQTGARLVGSEDAIQVGRSAGLPESQLFSTKGREEILCGNSAVVKGIPSTHGRVYFNRVPLQGSIPDDFHWPSYFWQFRHGQVFNWWIQINGLKVLHVDSAEFFEHEWTGLDVDLLCLCAVGRRWRPNYVADAVRIVQPKMIMACHWDSFFTSMDGPHYCLPGVNLDGFINEIESTGTMPLVLPIGASVQI